ncbi:MAG: type I-B CRISPR-associated protein Cas7/Cst2/DevR [Firmicutes bacterium]|nr:type I-B CRISPR-associated protein Cas7/Cst2/DevR [Bacillota bacterium]
MAFITGLVLIDAPASALNNIGKIEGTLTDNSTGVKFIRTREGAFPYVSAQAFRYWWRRTLEKGNWGWKSAPVFREAKIAYTEANPIAWWDDDLFGYMRAPASKASARKKTADVGLPVKEAVTRISPLRVGTLVALAPVPLVNDFGVMARHEGDPVPFEHQFYRATLHTLLSLDLHAVGTFTYIKRSGHLHLDEIRVKEAEKAGLEKLPAAKAYRLPLEERLLRITALLEALTRLEGGAKQAIHYTDVSPDILVLAVTKGGNHIFRHIFTTDAQRQPQLHLAALRETLTACADDILSPIYFGWPHGYLDHERERLEAALASNQLGAGWANRVVIQHPRQVVAALCRDLADNPTWLA